ncbi:elongation of very long chain fatty acids protein F [Drosophila sechellia]|uniref:Elongation of very long chain fatty acids protein n=1 Tax=Drosophila sechellia TaxID=7238 RepID=B4HJC9_DROSE|nr:elongation of very long chain fatty acids protein F [Drosophila sechellia]EDW42801.1 GM23845 [Drosophila sechellia]
MADLLNGTLIISEDPVRLPLIGSPWPSLTIVSLYLLFVLKLGRKFMENRKPYDLRGVIRAYNIMQIVYNGVVLIAGLHFLFVLRAYDLRCITRLPLDHELKSRERWLTYSYFFNKFIDLLETVFFVLRKKHRQISFLHVFHHLVMSFGGYLHITFNGYGGTLFPLCLLNVAVHVIMYAYYYLSSVSKDVQTSRWKKYITIVQLVQFLLVLANFSYTLMQPNCNASRTVIYSGMFVSTTFILMFANFYIHNYILNGSKQKRALKSD